MHLRCRSFTTLPPEAASLRKDIFMREQGFKDEFDALDSIAVHIVLFADGKPAGTCRFYYDDRAQSYIFGRLAVKKELRGRHLGLTLLQAAEQEIKARHGRSIMLTAQTQARDFYARQGYAAQGAEFFEEHCPHIMMRKDLSA